MPAARQSSTTLTGTRVPAITAWPLRTAGSVVINPSRSELIRPVCPCPPTQPSRPSDGPCGPRRAGPSMLALRPVRARTPAIAFHRPDLLDVLEENRRHTGASREDEGL